MPGWANCRDGRVQIVRAGFTNARHRAHRRHQPRRELNALVDRTDRIGRGHKIAPQHSTADLHRRASARHSRQHDSDRRALTVFGIRSPGNACPPRARNVPRRRSALAAQADTAVRAPAQACPPAAPAPQSSTWYVHAQLAGVTPEVLVPSTRPTGDLAMTSDLRSPSWVGVLARHGSSSPDISRPVDSRQRGDDGRLCGAQWHRPGPRRPETLQCASVPPPIAFMAAWRDTNRLTTSARRHLPDYRAPRTELPTGIFIAGCPTLVAARPSRGLMRHARGDHRSSGAGTNKVNPARSHPRSYQSNQRGIRGLEAEPVPGNAKLSRCRLQWETANVSYEVTIPTSSTTPC